MAHFSLNSQRLLRYENESAFLAFSIGKEASLVINEASEGQLNILENLNLGSISASFPYRKL